MCGEWTLVVPSVPGPFKTPYGKCFVLEMRLESVIQQVTDLGIPDDVLASGADWVLVWPGEKQLCLVWAAVANTSPGRVPLGKKLEERLTKPSGDPKWTWWAWILLAEPETSADKIECVDPKSHLTILRVPAKPHHNWPDLRAGLELALERMFGS